MPPDQGALMCRWGGVPSGCCGASMCSGNRTRLPRAAEGHRCPFMSRCCDWRSCGCQASSDASSCRWSWSESEVGGGIMLISLSLSSHISFSSRLLPFIPARPSEPKTHFGGRVHKNACRDRCNQRAPARYRLVTRMHSFAIVRVSFLHCHLCGST